MIEVTIIAETGFTKARIRTIADSIQEAVQRTKERLHTERVSVLFPIDPERYFVDGDGTERPGIS